MSTWEDVRQAIFANLVLASDLPSSHWSWADGPQNFTYDPRFLVSISRGRAVHDRRVVPNPPTAPYTLSSMVEATVGIRCESFRTTKAGAEKRLRALDALEYVRQGLSRRDDVYVALRAAGVAWFDDSGIVQLPAMQDDRVLLAYHCDLMMRVVIDQTPRAPALGEIDTVIADGSFPDPPRTDLVINITEPLP